jgi:hypothetical protein
MEWVEICGALEPMGIVDYTLKENMDVVVLTWKRRGESENTLELLDEVMDSTKAILDYTWFRPAEPNASDPL